MVIRIMHFFVQNHNFKLQQNTLGILNSLRTQVQKEYRNETYMLLWEYLIFKQLQYENTISKHLIYTHSLRCLIERDFTEICMCIPQMETDTYIQDIWFAIDEIPLTKLSLVSLTWKAVQQEKKHFLKCLELQWSKIRQKKKQQKIRQ